ncbi:2-oxo acid dehydrogenase subunit E2 [Neobacillus notoginsengisoli]|uniref:Dihydrolipoamide acetyltransferase component of pyruvate dehydrogenase complex n=1 Tax=Neobacillus notoginsengisoli TaxID=1578198 RepID=A0A417YX27_9BACI|nr:dihydrolipoamide acetyltransferase family protein [Neobacillus notoginsengisoli]RHW42106.1 2-oxo acid dehydrogenase subunit E2 [Neobacillus notoginsengisoli]
MEVKLHDIGEGMAEAEINCFLVKPGDYVKADDPLVEVQTDKMTAEIPSPSTGIVKEFLVAPGDTVPVGTTLIILETEGKGSSGEILRDKVMASQPEQASVAILQKEETYSPIFPRILASPYTRKIARDNSVKIEHVTGTGPAGRILDEDVYQYIEQSQTKTRKTSQLEQPQKEKQTVPAAIQGKTIPFRGRRKQIAKNLLTSIQTIPHCTHFEEVDVTNLIEFRKDLKAAGKSISASAFFIKALSVCLKEFPIFNAVLDEQKEEIELLEEHHIGTAVDTEDGLIVPVIKSVEKKSLPEINREMKALTEKALANELTVSDIQGGTFTVSNVGPLGGSIGATPIIQHPQVALVSFHKTKRMPVVNDQDEIEIRSIMNISMSFDHRVADGATAVKFTNLFAGYMKDPKMLLLELV